MKTVKVTVWAEVDDNVTPKEIMESLPPMPLKELSPIFKNSMHGSLRVREVEQDDFRKSLPPESEACFQWHDAKFKEVEESIKTKI